MALLLFLLAFILVAAFTPIGILATVIKSFFFWNKGILKEYFFKLAIVLDRFGNVALGPLFNLILIKGKSPNRFGNEKETISSVLGKNQEAADLIYLGKRLVALLDFLDKDHSLKSINN